VSYLKHTRLDCDDQPLVVDLHIDLDKCDEADPCAYDHTCRIHKLRWFLDAANLLHEAPEGKGEFERATAGGPFEASAPKPQTVLAPHITLIELAVRCKQLEELNKELLKALQCITIAAEALPYAHGRDMLTEAIAMANAAIKKVEERE
jgi:hypothetical protein